MPAAKGESAIVKRLAALLSALSAEYLPWEELIIAAGCYEHLSEPSARRMLRGDIDALRALGFQVERVDDTKAPYYRLVSHARFGSEILTKWCRHCRRKRRVDQFGVDARRADGRAIWCLACMAEDHKARMARLKAEKPETYAAYLAKQAAYQAANPERTRKRVRAWYHRKRAAGFRRLPGGRWAPEEPDAE